MPRLPGLLRAALTVACLGVACAVTDAAGATIEEGQIDGARFTVLRPTQPWNKRLLLLAHGFRAENAPQVADLSPEHLAYKTLVQEGWIVATTSYRRNGLILADALKDLDNLRAHIAAKDGSPSLVLLEGESMGGLIVTLLAERLPDLYGGAVAIGAALNIQDPLQPIGLTLEPRIPLLFLTNQSELGGPEAYVTRPRRASPDTVAPALFVVARDGHVNVNQAERLVALRALERWVADGAATLPKPLPGSRFFDATRPPEPTESQVRLDADQRGLTARVVEVSAVYGNLWLNVQPADFEAIGLQKGAAFQLQAGDQRIRVIYGRDFNSVKKGEWVVFPNADGFFWLARNFANAATSANLKAGDTVTIRRFDPPPAP